ncbi:TPA: hypothetical protein ACF2DS_002939 [Clostridium perfringens]|nr:hypothetical protein [Clostridium perfringens]
MKLKELFLLEILLCLTPNGDDTIFDKILKLLIIVIIFIIIIT